MSTITIEKSELQEIIRDSVKEILSTELMKFFAIIQPYVSSEEQADIEARYGLPKKDVEKTLTIDL